PWGALDSAVVVGRSPDGWVWLLHRTEFQACVDQTAVLRVESHALAGPQALDHFQVPIQTRHTLPFPQAKGLIFDLTIAQAHTKNKPPASHHVERSGLLGHGYRVEQRQ